jgi:hypothetical protein
MVSLITLASDTSQVPWILLVFTITQQIEGNLNLPWVMKGQASIPTVLLLIVMLFFWILVWIDRSIYSSSFSGCDDLSLPKPLYNCDRDSPFTDHHAVLSGVGSPHNSTKKQLTDRK